MAISRQARPCADELKRLVARQAGDEAKHYRLIEKRLGELGVDTSTYEPGPRSPLLQYLAGLDSTVERVAAGQFTREALAVVRNDEFIRFCVSRGDEATAAMYRDGHTFYLSANGVWLVDVVPPQYLRRS